MQLALSNSGTSVPLLLSGLTIGLTTLYLCYQLYRKSVHKSGPKLLENNQTKYAVPLVEREEVSHDTRRFRFGLPSDEHVLGLPTGQHLYLSTTINDKFVSRSYTPVSSDDDKGYVDLVVKVYFSNVNPKFPNGGLLSQHLDRLKIGETINIRGPNGHLVYDGRGKFSIRASYKAPFVARTFRNVGMIAGGTGITPMLQIIRQVFKDDRDRTRVWLLYANQTESDILLRRELEEVRGQNGDRFSLWFTLDRPPADWQFSSGFVDSAMIAAHLPPPSPDTLVLMCGPPPMVNHACLPNLDKLGYSKDNRFVY